MLSVATADAIPAERARPLAACIPADAMAAYIARPFPEKGRADQALSRMGQLVLLANRFGLLPKEGRLFADLGACLPIFSYSSSGL